jgi:hypothetical protein
LNLKSSSRALHKQHEPELAQNPAGRVEGLPYWGSLVAWVLTAALFAGLYVATAQRGAGWQDSGMYQWRVMQADYRGWSLVLAHPLYIAAGQLLLGIPIGSIEWRLNCFSGLGMAVALANLASLSTFLTRRLWIGVAVAAMVGVAHAAWWVATVAEVYTWTVAGLTLELCILIRLLGKPRRSYLILLFFINGLGWALHNLALLPLPVYVVIGLALVRRGTLPLASLPVAMGAYLLGAAPLLLLIVERLIQGQAVLQVIGETLVGSFGPAVFNTDPAQLLSQSTGLVALSFVGFLLPLALLGLPQLKSLLGRDAAASVGAITLIEALFVMRYNVPDQFTFLLPLLCMLGLCAAAGLWKMSRMSRKWRNAAVGICLISVLLAPLTFAAGPALLNLAGLQFKRARSLPFRDEVRYWLLPWKNDENSAESFALAALEQAAPDGIILADSTAVYPLLLVQRREVRYSRILVPTRSNPLGADDATGKDLLAAAAGRPVYTVSPLAGYTPNALLADASWVPEGVLYRLVAR